MVLDRRPSCSGNLGAETATVEKVGSASPALWVPPLDSHSGCVYFRHAPQLVIAHLSSTLVNEQC